MNGPKSHHIQVTPSPNQLLQQQQPSTQTIVNSTNNNSSVSNNNRKSSETVTSSPEGHAEEETAKAFSGTTANDSQEEKAEAAKALTTSLNEDEEVPLKEAQLKDESQQLLIKPSEAANVDSNNSSEDVAPSKEEPAIDAVKKGEDDSPGVKKVSWLQNR